jgi:hypothetical protein
MKMTVTAICQFLQFCNGAIYYLKKESHKRKDQDIG